MKQPKYTARHSENIKLTQEQKDLIERRVTAFLDATGMQKPLKHLMCEAYLQGCLDTLQVIQQEQQVVAVVNPLV